MNDINIIAASFPIKSILILKSSKAEIVRTFNVDLKGGQNKLTITRLPSGIERNSVRITGLNPSAPTNWTYLSDLVCTIPKPGKKKDGSGSTKNDSEEYQHLRDLESKYRTLVAELEILEIQRDSWAQYARNLAQRAIMQNQTSADPNAVSRFLAEYGEAGKDNAQKLEDLRRKIEEAKRGIKKEKERLSQVKGSLETEIIAVINAEFETKVELKLSYMVTDAGWSPTYELYTTTGEDGKPSRTVSLHYRARVRQSTGEDWNGASLTLSTISGDTNIKNLPKLEPIQLEVPYHLRDTYPHAHHTHHLNSNHAAPAATTMVYRDGRNRSRSRSRVRSPRAHHYHSAPAQIIIQQPAIARVGNDPDVLSLDSGLSEDEGDVIEAFEDTKESVSQTPMTLTYSVRGKCTISSSGKEHIVTIVVLQLEAELEYVCVPRVDPRVFLQGQIKNDSEYRLLPGLVINMMDDSYVSSTQISGVNRSDTFTFTLGDDPSIAISYEKVSKTDQEGARTFAEPIKIVTYTNTITIQNTHTFSIEKVTIRDAIPIQKDDTTQKPDKRIKVVLKQPVELQEAKEGEFIQVVGDRPIDSKSLKVKWEKEKEGLYEYRCEVGAGEQTKFATVFEIKSPEDLTYTFSNSE